MKLQTRHPQRTCLQNPTGRIKEIVNDQSSAELDQRESITFESNRRRAYMLHAELCLMSVGDIAEWTVVWDIKRAQLHKS
ncbi:hypothetical protein JTE90_000051 [Oedothorax gibbosus]|uniref:Uncharacterized protein n=1 Tax=Oedothorax gibbosus TaxID=931172 RepID=A0AAV6UEI7_9ARAC|nr:hypothetical protein JTE90_000051 [Oedothorax gibbosus]